MSAYTHSQWVQWGLLPNKSRRDCSFGITDDVENVAFLVVYIIGPIGQKEGGKASQDGRDMET